MNHISHFFPQANVYGWIFSHLQDIRTVYSYGREVVFFRESHKNSSNIYIKYSQERRFAKFEKIFNATQLCLFLLGFIVNKANEEE